MAYFEGLLKQEMIKWLGIMRDFELLPTVGGVNMGDVFLQKNYGDVTIVPKQRYLDYPNLIQDPDRDGMKRYIQVGEQATWPKLGIIRDHRRIELELIRRQSLLKAAGNTGKGSLGGELGEQRDELMDSPRLTPRDPIASKERAAKWRHERDMAVSELHDVVHLAVQLRESTLRARRMARVYHALIALLLALLYAALWWGWNDVVKLVMESVQVVGISRLVELSLIFSGALLLMSWFYEMYLTD